MLCPICKGHLENKELEKSLNVLVCEEHGIWLPAISYWKWIALQNITYPPKIEEGEFDEVSGQDTQGDKSCSDCGRFLTRYSIGHGVQFHVDQCSACAGIWLDSGEWEILKQKNLHNAIHFMFSEGWQSRVSKQIQQKNYDDMMAEKFGTELFEEIKQLRGRLSDLKLRDLAVAYLSNS